MTETPAGPSGARARSRTDPGRLVMVTTEFPPTPVVGALRQGKLASELERLGWGVTVVTVDDATHTPTLDASGIPLPPLGYAIPAGVRCARLGAWNPIASASRIRRGMAGAAPLPARPSRPSAGTNWRGRLTATFDKLSIPDEYALWVSGAVRAGVRSVHSSGADVIWGSWPWTSAVVAAAIVSRRTGVPLVVDFRDSWNAWPPRVASGAGRRWIEHRIERWVLGQAAGATAVTRGIVAEILAEHPRLEGRVGFFPQGFDPEEARVLDDPPSSAADGILRFIHGGRLSPGVADPEPLLTAARDAAVAGDLDRTRVRFTFLGAGLMDVGALAGRLGVADMVEVLPQVPRSEALQAFRRADVCTIIRTNAKEDWVTGKLWDYLTVGRPVLALVDGNSTASEIIRQTGAGTVVNVEARDNVRASLVDVWQRFCAGTLWSVDEQERASYSTPRIASDVAAFLSELASRHPAPKVTA